MPHVKAPVSSGGYGAQVHIPTHDEVLLQVGALVWGHVRRVEPFGLFIGLDKLRMSALLHISNMSRAHVADPEVRACVGISAAWRVSQRFCAQHGVLGALRRGCPGTERL